MEILVLVIAWLLVGCGVAWVMGAAISMGDAPAGNRASRQETLENFDHVSAGEVAPGGFVDDGAEFSAAAGTDRRRLRSK
jgi:hypothetical protein